MKNGWKPCVGAVVLLTGSAGAQSLVVTLDFDADDIAIGESATATVTASFSGWGAAAYFSHIAADLIFTGSGSIDITSVSGLSWGVPALGDVTTGEQVGNNLMGVFGAQHSLFGAPNTSNPLHVLSFTFVATSMGTFSFAAVASPDALAAFSVTDPTSNPFAAPVYFDGSAFQSETIGIPAPGALAVLGLGGLAAGRRRR